MAYVDDLSPEEMRDYRGTLTEPGRDSPYRERPVAESLDLFRRMKAGEFPNGARVLKPETVEMMSVNQMGDCRVCELKTVMPPYSNDAEFFPGMEKTWGLSFMINTEQAPTGRSAGSLAWAGLANSYFWIDPSRKIGGAYLTQILPFVDKKSFPLYLEFESTVYQNV